MTDAYAQSGVDTAAADTGVSALVGVLGTIDLGRSSRSVPLPGHFAAVLEVAPNLGIALATDGVGSKLIVAEQAQRYDTVGIDCVAMNVNDVVCVGAEPIALLDYLAVERVDPGVMREIAQGLKRGAELAGVEIPGGEVAVLPELIRGHPSPNGFDLTAACVGLVALDAIVSGAGCRPGDALIGVPSSGLHSNGYSLARRALAGLALDDRPPRLGGASVADVMLAPTTIYVRGVLELLRSGLRVHGLAHITGGGLLNLTRLNGDIGFTIDHPLPVPPVFGLVKELGGVADAEMWEVFNMGCGFCAVVPPSTADAAAALLGAHHPGARRIGTVTDRAGVVELPALGLSLGALITRSRFVGYLAPVSGPPSARSGSPAAPGTLESRFLRSQSSRVSSICSSRRSVRSCISSTSRSGSACSLMLPPRTSPARRASTSGTRRGRRAAGASAALRARRTRPPGRAPSARGGSARAATPLSWDRPCGGGTRFRRHPYRRAGPQGFGA